MSHFRSGRVAKRNLGTSGYQANSLVTLLKQLLTPPFQGIPARHSAPQFVDTQHQNGNKCEGKRNHERITLPQTLYILRDWHQVNGAETLTYSKLAHRYRLRLLYTIVCLRGSASAIVLQLSNDKGRVDVSRV